MARPINSRPARIADMIGAIISDNYRVIGGQLANVDHLAQLITDAIKRERS